MAMTVSKTTKWEIHSFIKIPYHLVICSDLTPNSRLVLMFLLNQVGYRPVSVSTIDSLLGIHRSTRIRCFAELRELGFIAGTDSHILLNDPQVVLAKLKEKRRATLSEVNVILTKDEYMELVTGSLKDKAEAAALVEKRDYLQDATDAWNRYRPKDYQKIRRMSAQVMKALDAHMRDLKVPAHNYDEFFSILKAGVEKSDFWLNQNSNKTLQSITGVGTPTDKKRSNVYNLFNEGATSPAKPVEEEDRKDTVTYPAAYRPLISDYLAAQYSYQQVHNRPEHSRFAVDAIIKAEQALKDVKLDPADFRYMDGITDWPTDTPYPTKPMVEDWNFDDEYGYVY